LNGTWKGPEEGRGVRVGDGPGGFVFLRAVPLPSPELPTQRLLFGGPKKKTKERKKNSFFSLLFFSSKTHVFVFVLARRILEKGREGKKREKKRT